MFYYISDWFTQPERWGFIYYRVFRATDNRCFFYYRVSRTFPLDFIMTVNSKKETPFSSSHTTNSGSWAAEEQLRLRLLISAVLLCSHAMVHPNSLCGERKNQRKRCAEIGIIPKQRQSCAKDPSPGCIVFKCFNCLSINSVSSCGILVFVVTWIQARYTAGVWLCLLNAVLQMPVVSSRVSFKGKVCLRISYKRFSSVVCVFPKEIK